MELFFVLIVLVLVPLIVASIVPAVSFIRQKIKYNESNPMGNGVMYEYTFSPGLVNHDLEGVYASNSAGTTVSYNSARNRGWIRGSSHVMSAEEFDQKKAREFSIQLP